MSEERTNRLAKEGSAYLRGAAHQPVDWYPWGEEAFKRAKDLDRPILLDVGAVWCHWCHVLDRESYDDEEIGKIINANFIPIKVDRDERPDVDRRYQQAVSAITGQGGWPLTAFMTPEGKVFFGGTYYPPKDTQQLPSFRNVLLRVIDYYRTKRESANAESEKIFQALAKMNELQPSSDEPSILWVDGAISSMMVMFDPINGGFRSAPKFPHFGTVELFLARYFETGDEELLNIVEQTLTKSAKGGIYDQIGGGFHRYSVDGQWIVPHFEKMSYDNAEHLKNYLLAYQATGDEFYRQVAEGILTFVTDVLSDSKKGGFYGSQDADIDLDDDGDYFTWTKEEVKEVLRSDEAKILSMYYNIFSRGEMKHNPTRNVLFVDMTVEEIGRKLGISGDKVKAAIKSGKKQLLEARGKRQTPYVDEILYTSWNAMMISSFLLAYKVLGDDKYKELALRTLDFLVQNCFDEEAGFYHTYVNNAAKVSGFLDDQVKMGIALLDAFEVTGNESYLNTAVNLSGIITGKFYDKRHGAFFDIEENQGVVATLKNRIKPIQDDPIPSANASAAMFFDRLYYLTDDYKYRNYSDKTLRYFGGVADKYGLYAASYFVSAHYHLKHPPQVVVVGKDNDPKTEKLLKTAWSIYRPHKLVVRVRPGDSKSTSLSPTIQEIAKMKAPIACVCAGTSCAEPTHDPEELALTIKTFGVR